MVIQWIYRREPIQQPKLFLEPVKRWFQILEQLGPVRQSRFPPPPPTRVTLVPNEIGGHHPVRSQTEAPGAELFGFFTGGTIVTVNEQSTH